MENKQLKRALWHDYSSKAIYMFTLSKRPGVPSFGTLAGDWRIPAGQAGSSYIKASPIGRAIKSCLLRLKSEEPAAQILQYALMPDHLHMLLQIKQSIDEHVGNLVARFKVAVNNEGGCPTVFSEGYNDQIVTPGRNLKVLVNYLRDNPRRLAVRRAHPEFFKRVNNLRIGDGTFQAYGNFQLLDNLFKEQVIVHRADSPEQRERSRERWLYTAANGGVLVSPFISAAEKEIRKEAEEAGGRFILIANQPMEERYKPSGHDFDLCEAGRLLIISYRSDTCETLSRAHCLAMNNLAEAIASNDNDKMTKKEGMF